MKSLTVTFKGVKVRYISTWKPFMGSTNFKVQGIKVKLLKL